MTSNLIDSDVLIEVLCRRDETIVSAWTTLADSGEPVFVSPVSIAEIWAGARQNEREAIAALFEARLCM